MRENISSLRSSSKLKDITSQELYVPEDESLKRISEKHAKTFNKTKEQLVNQQRAKHRLNMLLNKNANK